LFISAGKVITCAPATDAGATSMEMINIPTMKGTIDFFMLPLSRANRY